MVCKCCQGAGLTADNLVCSPLDQNVFLKLKIFKSSIFGAVQELEKPRKNRVPRGKAVGAKGAIIYCKPNKHIPAGTSK